MRSGFVVVLLAVLAGCNNSSSGGSGAASTSGASSADCVNKMVAWNPASGDPEKKIFTSMCDSLTADQRACVVAAKTADDGKKCIPNKPLQ